MQQIFAVQQHQQQTDQERAGNVNQEGGEWKSAVVIFIDSKGRQVADQ